MDPFTYELPIERIAQRPVHPPESAKMLCVNSSSGAIDDTFFSQLPKRLTERDLLVFNNTKVIPARMFGKLLNGEACEILLLQSCGDGKWVAMGRPMRQFTSDAEAIINDEVKVKFGKRIGPQAIEVYFSEKSSQKPIDDKSILELGIMPIPPYIREGKADDQDRIDYQPIFAEVSGSVASPTASLHFSDALCEAIKGQGVSFEFVTLHVGAASFLSLKLDENRRVLPPPSENMIFSSNLLSKIKHIKGSGGRVIAVGTTVVRALESMMRFGKSCKDGDEIATSLFLKPEDKFLAVDALITNFHQPGTTHLLLVESLLGRKKLEECYSFAISSGYRFLSYGDGMFIE